MRELTFWPVATGTFFFPAAAQFGLVQPQLTVVCRGSISARVGTCGVVLVAITKSGGDILSWEIVRWVELGL